MLDYAISDVVGLLPLADSLQAEIRARGLEEELEKRMAALQNGPREWNPFANYTRIPGFNRLGKSGRDLARLLWCARECYARRRDVPPTNVASKHELRHIVDRGLRDPQEIVRHLNKDRRRDLLSAEELRESIEEARLIIERM
jgi:ribonuclease D